MARTVRAAVCFAPREPLEVIEVELQDPGPGEVLVRFLASGLCHSDLHALEGTIDERFPLVAGHEAIGDVVAVGDGVRDFRAGDRVMAFLVPDCGTCPFCQSGRTNFCRQFPARRQNPRTVFAYRGQPLQSFMGIGSFAEMAVVPADQLVKVNPEARVDQACCIGCGVTTGIGAVLNSARVPPGASVAVFGVGGVGLSVVKGAKLAGAGPIIAIDRNPARRDVALAAGATHFILANGGEDPVAQVMAITGLGADFAFECVGLPELAAQALAATNPCWGMAVNVGLMPAGARLSAVPFHLLTGRHWTGSFMGGAKRADVARYVDMFVAGEFHLDDLVTHRLSLDEINRGFAMMRSGEAVRSVILF
ncbi:MAG: alcohol dehydrogenase catalytic domain-containing protein [Sphingomonadaceae bacterium]|uniref:alcohol dehydrogenase catalytic domain-containing protein n=1 Tax=Thermaurantiacus sp. TaxID=2820283 RepID=UPI00298ED209|nr:alcohol dehydrogenase catalytic domain-containing protein [Thermaurantiacus sp.]MCS6986814.1 alcohol dehydrogenase catalytic domain-containing protein [Sphingomonadaceae bacterium]MDW8413923.1 alcohol dehydrogenase catalytic domain-containing protein [Thermaurantiacus sp.]